MKLLFVWALALVLGGSSPSPRQIGSLDFTRKYYREHHLQVLRNLPTILFLDPGFYLDLPAMNWPPGDRQGRKDLAAEIGSLVELELTRTGLKVTRYKEGAVPADIGIEDPILSIDIDYNDTYFDQAIDVKFAIMEKVKIPRNGATTAFRVETWHVEHEIARTDKTTAADVKDAVGVLLTEFCLDWAKANPPH